MAISDGGCDGSDGKVRVVKGTKKSAPKGEDLSIALLLSRLIDTATEDDTSPPSVILGEWFCEHVAKSPEQVRSEIIAYCINSMFNHANFEGIRSFLCAMEGYDHNWVFKISKKAVGELYPTLISTLAEENHPNNKLTDIITRVLSRCPGEAVDILFNTETDKRVFIPILKQMFEHAQEN